VISTQAESAKFFGSCQDIPWLETCKNVIRKNGFFSQYRHFLHNKSSSNDKSLQIHKRWYSHSKQLFETVLDQEKILIFIPYIEKGWGGWERYYSFVKTIMYVILRTTLDIGLYSITRYTVVFAGRFSLNSNSNHTSTVLFLTDLFCREQSVTKVKIS